MKHELFYLVWREGGGIPTYKHSTQQLAEMEAERLARGNPGDTFHVMACLSSVKRTDIVWTRPDPNADLPF